MRIRFQFGIEQDESPMAADEARCVHIAGVYSLAVMTGSGEAAWLWYEDVLSVFLFFFFFFFQMLLKDWIMS